MEKRTNLQAAVKHQEKLLLPSGGYRKLKSFQLTQSIQDITIRFVELYRPKESRTQHRRSDRRRKKKSGL